MKYIKPSYSDREGRNIYVLELLNKFFSDTQTILNLGGGQKRYLKNSKFKVTEVDLEGDNDININLDKIDRLPLDNETFDTVLALDVLEHLENFHLIFEEMVRVARKNIIISLPNSVLSLYSILKDLTQKDRFNSGYYNKFYGLPLNKPKDRHRWFLTISDIERFFKNKAVEKNLDLDFIFPKLNSKKSIILKMFLNDRLEKEILTKYCWIILKKIK